MIVEDSFAIREGVKSILGLHPEEWSIVGECSDGEQALRLARELNPEIMLVDISLPGSNGLAVAKAIRSLGAKTRIVIMSAQDATVLEVLARNVGFPCVPKSRLAAELVAAMRSALSSSPGV